MAWEPGSSGQQPCFFLSYAPTPQYDRLQRRYLGRKIAQIAYRHQSAAIGIPTREEFGRLPGPMASIVCKKFVGHAPVYPLEGTYPQRPRLRRTPEQDAGGAT